MAETSKDSMATVAELAPVTAERRLRNDLEAKLPKPYMARALIAPDTEHVNGSAGHKHRNMSVLQQHVAFFDINNDGIIYPQETIKGFRAIGFNAVASFLCAIFLHAAISYATSPVYACAVLPSGELYFNILSWLPSPFFPIYIKNIHKGMHGSDSATYDTEGRFIPANLENIFSKYGRTVPDKLSLKELWTMTQANHDAFDLFGWIISKAEWGVLYVLAKDKDGYLSKEAVRRCFDGSLFEYYAKVQKGTAEKMG